MLSMGRLGRRDERGVVGFNLALTIAFALFAVIELSRVVLAASQIDDRVKVIITEVGPGSNVSRLDETQKLNETGRMAEEILAAAEPLSGQAQQIIDTAGSIDRTVSQILQNAGEINQTVRSIDSITKQLLPVVQNIHGDETMSAQNGGVAAINKRAASRRARGGRHPERPEPGQHPRHAGLRRPARRGHLQQHGAEPPEPGQRPLHAGHRGHCSVSSAQPSHTERPAGSAGGPLCIPPRERPGPWGAGQIFGPTAWASLVEAAASWAWSRRRTTTMATMVSPRRTRAWAPLT